MLVEDGASCCAVCRRRVLQWRQYRYPQVARRGGIRENIVATPVTPGETAHGLHAAVMAEGWVRDVTEDIARAAVEMASAEGRTLGPIARDFVERATGKDVPTDLIEASFG